MNEDLPPTGSPQTSLDQRQSVDSETRIPISDSVDGSVAETTGQVPQSLAEGTENIAKIQQIAVAENVARKEDEEKGRDRSSDDSFYDFVAARAGDTYELEEIARRDGKTVEEVKELILNDTAALIDYGKRITQNLTKYGEKLSPQQEAFVAICGFLESLNDEGHDQGVPRRIGRGKGDLLYHADITSKKTADGVLVFRIDGRQGTSNILRETWSASPLASMYIFKQNVYTVEEDGKNQGFDTIYKTRQITEEDVERLKSQLAAFEPDDE